MRLAQFITLLVVSMALIVVSWQNTGLRREIAACDQVVETRQALICELLSEREQVYNAKLGMLVPREFAAADSMTYYEVEPYWKVKP